MGITDISLPSIVCTLHAYIYIFSTPSLSFIQQDSFKENSLQIYIYINKKKKTLQLVSPFMEMKIKLSR